MDEEGKEVHPSGGNGREVNRTWRQPSVAVIAEMVLTSKTSLFGDCTTLSLGRAGVVGNIYLYCKPEVWCKRAENKRKEYGLCRYCDLWFLLKSHCLDQTEMKGKSGIWRTGIRTPCFSAASFSSPASLCASSSSPCPEKWYSWPTVSGRLTETSYLSGHLVLHGSFSVSLFFAPPPLFFGGWVGYASSRFLLRCLLPPPYRCRFV